MKNHIWFSYIKRMFCMGIISAVAGAAILTVVFCLPVNTMTRHVNSSAAAMLKNASELEDGWEHYLWDNMELYTDAIMVQNAIEKIEGKNSFEHAMWMYHLDLDENVWSPETSLKYRAGGGDTSVMFLHQYSRYWHGYLVYLKPLLLLLDWEQIVWTGGILQVLLTAAALFVAVRIRKPEVGIALAVGLLFMKPIRMVISLAMGVCWVITLGAILFMMFRHTKIEQKDRYPEFFLAIGILVAYFDFLTYPMVALGFPLCAYFLIKKEEGLKQNVIKMLAYSVCWGLGYVGMWGMKWLIADAALQIGTIRLAFSSILGWTEALGGQSRFSGALYAISLNLREYDPWFYSAVAAALVLADVAAFVYACRKTSLKRAAAGCVPFLFIALLPFAWYFVVQHHSGLHVVFTFRIVSVAGMAFGGMGLKLLRLGRDKSGRGQNLEAESDQPVYRQGAA